MDQGFKEAYPHLFTSESINRKKEIIWLIFFSNENYRNHLASCQINTLQDNCKICDNVTGFSNVMLMFEIGLKRKISNKNLIEHYENFLNK